MPKLIIFDLDNTLIEGDSDRNWGQFLVEEKLVSEDYLLESEKFYSSYYDGNLDIDSFLSFCLEPLKNNQMDKLIDIRKKFIDTKIKPIIRDKAMRVVLGEIKKNNKVIIATATNSFVTEPIAELFSVKELIATEFEIIDNKFTGKVKGLPCFREGKLGKVNEWLESQSYDLCDATFYTDSFNDLPLLEKVGKAIVVDGDDKLTLLAKKNGWECVSFR
ncbi:MAG: HAD family hydrolase [Pelagibacterales bacterium]|nr:HAD family hydrolase [Pelagibacterales bacterium]|tara:strand:- start:2416 stop:3069 length:654 start_codon:yes stop_codon:yes gene_type:complete